jgi:hypothetical protein
MLPGFKHPTHPPIGKQSQNCDPTQIGASVQLPRGIRRRTQAEGIITSCEFD